LFCSALFSLWRAFGTIVRNEAINSQTAVWIRHAGIYFAATSLVMVLSHPIYTAIASLGGEAGQQFLSVEFATPELMTFLVSSILIVLGHVFLLAAEISDDNRLTV
jgi:hypothetical protein